MKKRNILFVIIGFFAIFSTLVCFADNDQKEGLMVNGTATLQVKPDLAIVSLGVVSYGKDVRSASQQNAAKIDKVYQALNSLNIPKDQIQTGNYSVIPQWSRRPKDAPRNWRSQIVGYKLSNSLIIKTADVKNSGLIIDKCIKAGANSVNSVNFTLKNYANYQSKVYAMATENAIINAKAIAKAANISVHKIEYISMDSSVRPVMDAYRGNLLLKAGGSNSVATKISPNFIELKGSVSMCYKIEK